VDWLLELKPGATKQMVLKAMESHVLAEGELMGTYQRKQVRAEGVWVTHLRPGFLMDDRLRGWRGGGLRHCSGRVRLTRPAPEPA
jgi:hypothetical protein